MKTYTYIYIVNPAASHGFAHAFPESLLNISRTFLVLAPPKLKWLESLIGYQVMRPHLALTTQSWNKKWIHHVAEGWRRSNESYEVNAFMDRIGWTMPTIVNPAASHGFAHAFPESLLNISRTFLVLAPPKLKWLESLIGYQVMRPHLALTTQSWNKKWIHHYPFLPSRVGGCGNQKMKRRRWFPLANGLQNAIKRTTKKRDFSTDLWWKCGPNFRSSQFLYINFKHTVGPPSTTPLQSLKILFKNSKKVCRTTGPQRSWYKHTTSQDLFLQQIKSRLESS